MASPWVYELRTSQASAAPKNWESHISCTWTPLHHTAVVGGSNLEKIWEGIEPYWGSVHNFLADDIDPTVIFPCLVHDKRICKYLGGELLEKTRDDMQAWVPNFRNKDAGVSWSISRHAISRAKHHLFLGLCGLNQPDSHDPSGEFKYTAVKPIRKQTKMPVLDSFKFSLKTSLLTIGQCSLWCQF